MRRDRLARDDAVYRWLIRRIIAAGSATFLTTYAEAARGSGYDVPRLSSRAARKEARHRRVSTVYRALRSLEAAGILRFEGYKRPNGQWRCLRIRLLPAGAGRAVAGRSRRRPRRRACRRISFSARSGTSPAVGDSQTAGWMPSAGTRAREGPRTAARSERGAVRAAIVQSLSAARAIPAAPPPGRRDPYKPFRSIDADAVALCEAFEDAFGRPHGSQLDQFSFRCHVPLLRRCLDRLDRYWHGGAPGAGVEQARTLVQTVAEDLPWPLYSPQEPQSLAWFLPLLDELSKDRRRWWKRHGEPRNRKGTA